MTTTPHRSNVNPRELAGAALIVALTSAADKQVAVMSALARATTKAISGKAETAIEKEWAKANAETLTFIKLVMKNNPTKALDDILARPDVQQALTQPYEMAALASKTIIEEAWSDSSSNAVKRAKGEIALIKGKWKGWTEDRTLVNRLLKDVQVNSKAMRKRLIAAMAEDDYGTALDKAANDITLRNRYTIQAAVWGAARMVRDSAFAAAGLNSQWVARFGPNMCSNCKALHGHVVGPGEEFPHEFDHVPVLKVYNGILLGPPRHPNCECGTVPTRKPRTMLNAIVTS
jgi:hypothetical protein